VWLGKEGRMRGGLARSVSARPRMKKTPMEFRRGLLGLVWPQEVARI